MAFRRRSLRSFQVFLLQAGNAAFAAWTAWSRPSFWVSVTLASSSPVTGSEIFIRLEESILWPFTTFGNPAVRRALLTACSRLGWGIDGGVAFEFIRIGPFAKRFMSSSVLGGRGRGWRCGAFHAPSPIVLRHQNPFGGIP